MGVREACRWFSGNEKEIGMGKVKHFSIPKSMLEPLRQVCNSLTEETNIAFNATKLLYLVLLLYNRNKRKFIENFSRLAKEKETNLVGVKNNKNYLLDRDKIRELLLQKGMTIAQASRKIFGNDTVLYKYVRYNGECKSMGRQYVAQLARLLGVSVNEIAYKSKYLKLETGKDEK